MLIPTKEIVVIQIGWYSPFLFPISLRHDPIVYRRLEKTTIWVQKLTQNTHPPGKRKEGLKPRRRSQQKQTPPKKRKNKTPSATLDWRATKKINRPLYNSLHNAGEMIAPNIHHIYTPPIDRLRKKMSISNPSLSYSYFPCRSKRPAR